MDSFNDRQQETAPAATTGDAKLDAAQFSLLVDRCQRRIFTYILNKVRNHAAAEDLTQDSLSKAWESRATFDPQKDELAWLIAIADHTITDRIRYQNAKKREPASGQVVSRTDGHFAIGPTIDTAVRQEIDPAAPLIDAEQIAALNAAVERLDPSKRQAIEFYRAGLSQKEIASRMQMSVGTVGSLISRAKQELKEMVSAKVD